jgi:hypothetical protein
MNRTMHSNNTSGVIGVAWNIKVNKWRVKIKSKHIGYFDDLEDAREARKAAEVKYFGEYSRDASRGPFKYEGPQLF